MATTTSSPTYVRVRGTGKNVLARIKLYLGPDHLLQVTSNGFSETYKRFFFRDIQVISLHKTATGTIWNVVWAGLTAMFALIAAVVAWSGDAGSIVLWILAGLMAGFLGLNLAWGPTCACYIQTAVQQQRLFSMSRIPRARKLINRVKPLLAEAQATAVTTAVAATAPDASAPLGENAPPPDETAPAAGEPAPPGTPSSDEPP